MAENCKTCGVALSCAEESLIDGALRGDCYPCHATGLANGLDRALAERDEARHEASDYALDAVRAEAHNAALREALEKVQAIPNELSGGDWDEIQLARDIAAAVLSQPPPVSSYRERDDVVAMIAYEVTCAHLRQMMPAEMFPPQPWAKAVLDDVRARLHSLATQDQETPDAG